MSTITKSVHIDTEVEVELDLTDVLNDADNDDVMDYLRDSMGTTSILDSLDESDVMRWVSRNVSNEDLLDDMSETEILSWINDNIEPEDVAASLDAEILALLKPASAPALTGSDFVQADLSIPGLYVATLKCDKGGVATIARVGSLANWRWIVRVQYDIALDWQHFEASGEEQAFTLAKALIAWHHAAAASA